MKSDDLKVQRSNRVWLDAQSCDLEDFKKQISRATDLADYPHAAKIVSNVPIYDCADVRKTAGDPDGRKSVMAEWAEVMLSGPGIVVLKGAYPSTTIVDAASQVFFDIVADQHKQGTAAGDHFAKPGANDRAWNTIEKLALRAPDVFANYYANDMIAMVCEAWLGPGYQITAQLNIVNPGGEAQSVHRDYHMGFQTAKEIERFPVHAHQLSPVLTLQGAVAHVDMPVETGPTLYLPYSQTFVPGYFAWRRPEFKEFFNSNYVQLPLAKGDAAFFNPALFHAAGTNRTTEVRRMANLLQISSAYGRAMETVDRARMSLALYPMLKRMKADGRLDAGQIANVVAACAEGYAFPTNLDRDPPLGGLAPASQQAMMLQALAENWDITKFNHELAAGAWRKLT